MLRVIHWIRSTDFCTLSAKGQSTDLSAGKIFVDTSQVCEWQDVFFFEIVHKNKPVLIKRRSDICRDLQTCIFPSFQVKLLTMSPTWRCMFPCHTPSAVEDKQMNTRQKECVCVKACRATSLGMNLFQSHSVFPNQLSHGCHMHSLLYLPVASLSCACSVSHTQNTLCQIPYACSGNDKSLQRPALLCQKGCRVGLECPSSAWLAVWWRTKERTKIQGYVTLTSISIKSISWWVKGGESFYFSSWLKV